MTIYDGRPSFYQWDLNQKVTSEYFQVGDKIHFYSMRHPTALVTKAYLLENKVVADVPNILLQTTNPIRVYRYISDSISAETVEERVFIVNQKPQPPDYFYTETELYELRNAVERAVEEVNDAEQKRELAESDRRDTELIRADNETTRNLAETSRGAAETARANAETLRAEVESKRVTAETKRVTAEQGRVDAETVRQSEEQKRQSAETLRQTTFEQSYNNVANALKGSVSGEVVRVDDVSPIEHTAKAKVCGKNLFDMSKFQTTSSSCHISEVGENYIVVNTPEGYKGSGNCGLLLRLIDFCPSIKEGTYILSGESPSSNKCIYLRDTNKYWNFGSAFAITDDDINSRIAVYGFSAMHGDGAGDCEVKNIQLEEGDTATEYEPYIDPTTVTVTVYGEDEAESTTYTPATDGTVEIASISPTMTLLTDTEGVTIEAEYNRDANLVVSDLQSQIDSLKELITELRG